MARSSEIKRYFWSHGAANLQKKKEVWNLVSIGFAFDSAFDVAFDFCLFLYSSKISSRVRSLMTRRIHIFNVS